MVYIYATLAVLPALVFLVILLFGGDLDGDGDIGEGDDGSHGPGPLSPKLILGFLCGLGAGGALSEAGDWAWPSWVWGLIFGFVVYVVVFLLLFFLYGQRSNTQSRDDSLVGARGSVFSAIGPEGTGEIAVVDPGTGSMRYVRAFAPGKEFGIGERVTVRSMSGGVALVQSDESMS